MPTQSTPSIKPKVKGWGQSTPSKKPKVKGWGQPHRRDRRSGLPKSRVRQIILGTARGGQNYADAEYPVRNRLKRGGFSFW